MEKINIVITELPFQVNKAEFLQKDFGGKGQI